jgi:outer membrane protein insertion porin family
MRRAERRTIRPWKRTARYAAVLGAIVVCCLGSLASAQETTLLGRPVTQITFRTDSPFDTAHLSALVTIKPAQPLTTRAVQDSIKNLFATGDFRDIQVEATAEAAGVQLTFVLSLNYRVDAISYDGVGGSERLRVARDVVVHTGDVLSLSAVDRSAVAIQSDLARRGYLEATVDPETSFSRSNSRATVVFHVNRGPSATVRSVNITGELAPYGPDDLIKQMRRGPGRRFDTELARSDAARMARFLHSHDYRKADVRYVGQKYDPASKTVALTYNVVTGPKVRVEVEGVPRSNVRRMIPFGKNQGYSADVIDRAADKILTSYQQKGYFQVAVDTDEKLVGGEWVITYKIVPGPKVGLSAVHFSGNALLSDRELSKVVATSPSGGIGALVATLLRRPTGVTQSQLRSDRDALESYYRIQGFGLARISDPVTKVVGDKLLVTFPISEGPRTMVSEVRIEGNEKVASKQLPKLQLRQGEPLNPQLLHADLINLLTFYADKGYSESQVTDRLQLSPGNTSAKITYVIAEGPMVHVDEVIIRGNTYTKTTVITRKAEIERGDPFSYRSLLEAQQRLYRLGIFQRVDIQPQRAGTTVGTRDIVIQVEEGKDLTVSGSVGISSGVDATSNAPKLRGSVSIAHRNLFGTGRYVGLEGIAGMDSQAFLTYREPFIFHYDIPLQLSLFRTDDRTRQNAHIRQQGASIEVQRVWQLQTLWSLRYEYKISECLPNPKVKASDDLCRSEPQTPIPGLLREQQNVHIASITPTFFWDKRDDPLNPHRGFFTTANVQYAFRLFTARTRFLKEAGQGSYYLPLSPRTTFVAAVRLGFIQPQGAPGEGLVAVPFAEVPFAERFTAGGENSHRAYALDHLGIVGETIVVATNGRTNIPIGGNGLAIINAEYRFPIVSSFGGAAFIDGGNVWRQASDIRLRQFRWGIGTGFRYLSPVGPARFDIGYKLKEMPNESRFAFFLSLGYPF